MLGPLTFADQANSFGKMFGGDALAAMTKAAFVVASRRSRTITVLASSRWTDFNHPIPAGSIIDLVAERLQTGRSSMTFVVELWSETWLEGSRQLTARGEFVMVSVAGGPSATLIAETRAAVPGGGRAIHSRLPWPALTPHYPQCRKNYVP